MYKRSERNTPQSCIQNIKGQAVPLVSSSCPVHAHPCRSVLHTRRKEARETRRNTRRKEASGASGAARVLVHLSSFLSGSPPGSLPTDRVKSLVSSGSWFLASSTRGNKSSLDPNIHSDGPKFPKSLCNGDFRFVGILACGRVLR